MGMLERTDRDRGRPPAESGVESDEARGARRWHVLPAPVGRVHADEPEQVVQIDLGTVKLRYVSEQVDGRAEALRITEEIKKYLREVWSELKKVSWPQRKEIIASTVVVILCTFIIAFFLGIVDVALQKVLGYLIR